MANRWGGSDQASGWGGGTTGGTGGTGGTGSTGNTGGSGSTDAQKRASVRNELMKQGRMAEYNAQAQRDQAAADAEAKGHGFGKVGSAAQSASGGLNDPNVNSITGLDKFMSPWSAGAQQEQKKKDYEDKSFWDHVKGFFGFHEVEPTTPGVPGDETADVEFDPMRAPIIGLGLAFIPGLGPILSGMYSLASGIYQGNPVAAITGAIPVIGSMISPAAGAVANMIGTAGTAANAVAAISGYEGIDDALGTNGTGPGIGAPRAQTQSSLGTAQGSTKGFSNVSGVSQASKSGGTSRSVVADPQTAPSEAQQSQLRQLYGIVSGVEEGAAPEGVPARTSQGFGGRPNQGQRTSYRYA